MSFRRKKGSSSSQEGLTPKKQEVKQVVKRRKMADKTEEKLSTLEEIDHKLSYITVCLSNMNSKLESVANKHTELDNDVNGDGGVFEEIEGAKIVIGETQADISTLTDLLSENTKSMRLLTAVVIK